MDCASSIIILGSARSYGNTLTAVNTVIADLKPKIEIINLNQLKISPYDYDNCNQTDDYLPLMEKIVTYKLIVLATPIYWSTMSAQMKIFVDRFSDLITIRKALGRQLRGKSLFILATYGTSMPENFEEPFQKTASYLGLVYQGCCYYYSGKDASVTQNNDQQVQEAKAILTSF